jgi:ribosomal protein S19
MGNVRSGEICGGLTHWSRDSKTELSEAGAGLLRIERAQHAATRAELVRLRSQRAEITPEMIDAGVNVLWNSGSLR